MSEDKTITLEEFAENLLEEKNLPNLENEVKEEMKQDLLSRLDDHINAALIAALSPGQQEELDQLTEKDDFKDEKIQQFFVDNIEDFSMVFAGILMGFRKTYLGL